MTAASSPPSDAAIVDLELIMTQKQDVVAAIHLMSKDLSQRQVLCSPTRTRVDVLDSTTSTMDINTGQWPGFGILCKGFCAIFVNKERKVD